MGHNPADIITAPISIALLLLTVYISFHTCYYLKKVGFNFKCIKNAIKPGKNHILSLSILLLLFVSLILFFGIKRQNKILRGEFKVEIGRISSTHVYTKKGAKGSKEKYTNFSVDTFHGKQLNFKEREYYNLTPYLNSQEMIYIIYDGKIVLKFGTYNETFDKSQYNKKITKLKNEYILSIKKGVFNDKNIRDSGFTLFIPLLFYTDIILVMLNIFLKIKSRNSR